MNFTFFLILLTIEALLYLLSRGRVKEFFKELDKKNYPLSETFMPMGHFLLALIGYKYSSTYDNKAFSKLAELYDFRQGRFFLQIHWAKKMGNLLLGLLIGSFLLLAYGETDMALLIFVVFISIVLFLLPDFELNKALEKRHLQLRLDFPDFINKLILLINAGMTINRAWERVASASHKETPLYEEVTRASLEVKGGKSEGEVYEEFARRCRIPEISRFITVILQNLRKGNAEMVAVLRVQASECWEMRKHTAKRLGEEASTKLLLPLMLMFLAILIIVGTPALLALSNM